MMAEQETYADPFDTLADLTREFREVFLQEVPRPLSPYAAEILGSIAALVTHCEHLGQMVERLSRNDPGAFQAFQRAMDKA
jgi:hypothetical protein